MEYFSNTDFIYSLDQVFFHWRYLGELKCSHSYFCLLPPTTSIPQAPRKNAWETTLNPRPTLTPPRLRLFVVEKKTYIHTNQKWWLSSHLKRHSTKPKKSRNHIIYAATFLSGPKNMRSKVDDHCNNHKLSINIFWLEIKKYTCRIRHLRKQWGWCKCINTQSVTVTQSCIKVRLTEPCNYICQF